MTTRLACAVCVAVLAPVWGPAEAQLIHFKTIPVAASEQFAFFPSGGLTGVSIALADTLLDPFNNPAKAARLKRPQYFGAPSFYSVSGNSGGGTTLPVGALWKRGSAFAGLAAAFQQINRPEEQQFFGGRGVITGADGPIFPGGGFVESGFEQQPVSQRNNYAFAMLGHTLDSAGLSVAVSVFWSGLKALDGVDQFYSGNRSLVQLGDAVDMRLGVTKEFSEGRSLEAVLVRNRFGMSHEIGFMELFWDPGLRQPIARPRHEHNTERTGVWGLHVEYEQPLDSGWRIGALATTNRITHPSIPNYEITSGLGNEGRSVAFNLGGGIGRTVGLTTFGVDAIYEPIRSRTGVRDTVDNRFRFNNAKLRGGVRRDFPLLMPGNLVRLQAGAEYHWINYLLDQNDLVNAVERRRKESWLERSRSGGVSFMTPTIQMHYQVSARTGVGRPGVFPQSGGGDVEFLSTAPWRPQGTASTLGAVLVTRHQFSISVPVR